MFFQRDLFFCWVPETRQTTQSFGRASEIQQRKERREKKREKKKAIGMQGVSIRRQLVETDRIVTDKTEI